MIKVVFLLEREQPPPGSTSPDNPQQSFPVKLAEVQAADAKRRLRKAFDILLRSGSSSEDNSLPDAPREAVEE